MNDDLEKLKAQVKPTREWMNGAYIDVTVHAQAAFKLLAYIDALEKALHRLEQPVKEADVSDAEILKIANACWKEYDTEVKWKVRFARAVLALRGDVSAIRDAARYKWLCENARVVPEHWGGRWSLVMECRYTGLISESIDAARSQEGETP